jgi:diguanylate cyclase (GGDEF)-like protein
VANYDPLTLLPNRRLLSDRLKRSLVRTQRSGRLTAICGLDLDGFKHINDQHGHAIGDRFLMIMAQQLAAGLRAEDTLARLSGDEFVVLLSDLSTPKDCLLALDRMLDTVRLPLVVDGLSLHTTASIGVTLYPLDNADPDTLLRHADQAMYAAKQAGKDRYQLFDPDIDRKAQVERAFLDQLRQGLADETFVLFYQPKVDLVNGEVIGAEALIRWRHPQRGLLSPAEFLPQIIGTDLEHQFDEWVIHTALHQMQQWADEGLDIKVSINISAQHLLQADFHARLAQSLARFPRVVPAHVELEVLETAAIADMAQAVGILQQCMRLGVQFALDDFGTGYSSLTYLRKLPVHTLKIDQSFVRDMLVDPDDLSIVQGVIELAGAFHRQVIAEGVETQAHGVRLREMGCRFAQGYGIARPMPAQELPAWCRAWPRSPVWRA